MVRRFFIPERSLAVVLGTAGAAKIVAARPELRPRVSRRSGFAESVEVLVRRRRGRLCRVLHWCLPLSRGSQGEHKESCYRGPSPKDHRDLLHLPVAWQAEAQITKKSWY